MNNITSLSLPKISKEERILHSYFRFPGSFHPPLVKWLILQNKNIKNIGDPLAGSGTVAVEGIMNNCNVVSMDIDPLSCLITHVKSNPQDPYETNEIISQWIDYIGPLPWPFQANKKRANEIIDRLEAETKYRRPKNVFHWFDPYVVIALSKILLSINEVECSLEYLKILESIVATIIRRVSRADIQPVSGLEVTKIMKKKLNDGLAFNVLNELKVKSNNLILSYEKLLKYDKLGSSKVYEGDVIDKWGSICKKNKYKFDLIITSPPYCNAIEYWRRHRLEYFWLGLLDNEEILNLSRKFIGSTTILKKELEKSIVNDKIINNIEAIKKLNKLGRKRKSLIINKYLLDIKIWINEIMKTMESNGKVYIIVGPSVSYGVKINTPKIMIDIIKEFGYEPITKLKYHITNQRMQYTLKNNTRIKSETIIEIINK